jgi:hypothetical protein
MTITIIVVAFVLCATALFFMAARSRRNHAVVRPIDLKALRTLMDRDDENFLREKLSRKMFFKLKRQRVRVTLHYVSRIADNSAAVLRIGGTVRLSPNPEVAQAAAEAIELASQIRMQCLVAFAKLTTEFVFPAVQFTPAMLVPKYQSLHDTVVRLSSLQPQNAVPLASAI